jgi:hypothetical protein
MVHIAFELRLGFHEFIRHRIVPDAEQPCDLRLKLACLSAPCADQSTCASAYLGRLWRRQITDR